MSYETHLSDTGMRDQDDSYNEYVQLFKHFHSMSNEVLIGHTTRVYHVYKQKSARSMQYRQSMLWIYHDQADVGL